MAVTAVTNWSGGALGAQPTIATEPAFASAGGTQANAVYSAAIRAESGQSVRVSGVRDFVLNMTGNHWRIGLTASRVSGTISAGQAAIILRSATTNRGDAFLRNQNGGNWALRGASGGTTYAGQDTSVVSNGSGNYRIEIEYTSDGASTHTARMMLYYPGNTAIPAIPDANWTTTLAGAIDNLRILNPTGVTGMTIDFGTLWYESTGAPIWESVSPPAGTLTFLSNVWASQTEAVFVGKVAGATDVEVQVGSETETVAPDADGYFRAAVTGLSAATSYAWTVLVDGVSRRTGNITTLPSTANGLTFLWGSCFDTYTSGFFANADARNPDFIVGLGDHGYFYLNGVLASNDVAVVRTTREPVLTAAAPQALFTKYPYSHTYSDTDGAGANSDGTWVGFTSGAVQAAYRQQFAHPTLPLSDSQARYWVIGRVRFIQTDELTKASPRGDTDNSSKSKLGTAQKTWFKAQIDAAVAAGQSVVWFGDGPWLGAALTGGTNNQWTAYSTERTELGNYIVASGVKLVRLHGDTHTLFYDNGTNNSWGGFPSASAAPFHTTANTYTPTTSGPKWPTVQTNSSRQYGVANLTDNGTSIILNLAGYSSTNAAPTEVERFNASIDLTPSALPTQPWDAVYVGGALADTVYVGSELVWSA